MGKIIKFKKVGWKKRILVWTLLALLCFFGGAVGNRIHYFYDLNVIKRKPMNIVFSMNDRYAPLTATAITSIVENSDETDSFKFYILESTLSPEIKKQLKEYVHSLGKSEVIFFHIDSSRFSKLHIRRTHLTVESYFRFILPELISDSKALYLDGDVVVLESLKELYDTDISKVYAAVVRDKHTEDLSDPDKINRTRLKLKKVYFNAGVMLLNLDKMRQDSIVNKLFENEKVLYNERLLLVEDQDVLNYTFDDNVIVLPQKFNVMTHPPMSKTSEISIIHFTLKPWRLAPLVSRIYYLYKAKTPWKDIKKYLKNGSTEKILPQDSTKG